MGNFTKFMGQVIVDKGKYFLISCDLETDAKEKVWIDLFSWTLYGCFMLETTQIISLGLIRNKKYVSLKSFGG